jgi:tetratricopeptide (TPR) repeat protein
MHPTNAGLFVGRGDAYNNLKDYARGIADFDHALALDPKNDEAMNDRAWALVRQGKYTEAIEGYDGALKIAKELRGLVLSNRCEANAMAGAIDAALMDCDAALAIAPENADYLQMRGFAKFKGERYAAAIADYDAALRVDPKHTFALFQRGVAQLKLGQGDAGQSDITTAEQIQPKVRAGLAELGITAPGKQ